MYIYTVPQVKSKTICFSSLTYISAVLNGETKNILFYSSLVVLYLLSCEGSVF